MSVLDCIERIPSVLLSIQKNRKDNFERLKEYLKGEKITHIVFVGSGSSYNAAYTTRAFYEDLGFHVEFYYPNIFLNYTKNYNPYALYVFISQGGSTKLVYKAIEKVQKLGYKNCSITSDLNSPVSKLSDVSVDMGCGDEEYLYRTIGFSSTVSVCWQLALFLSGVNCTDYDADYRNMVANLKNIEEQTIKYYQKHKFSLLKNKMAFMTGTNDLYPIANETDIKMMEMVPMVTRSFELEEFIHGPQNCFDKTISYFIFARKGEDEEKVLGIAQFLKKEIGYCALIGNIKLDEHDLYFEPKSQYFSALEYVTVSQVLSYCWATDMGRDLSRPVNGIVKKYVSKTL